MLEEAQISVMQERKSSTAHSLSPSEDGLDPNGSDIVTRTIWWYCEHLTHANPNQCERWLAEREPSVATDRRT